MTPRHTATLPAQKGDKQLQGITLESVLEKRRLDQALNAKEFAVLRWRLLFHGARLVPCSWLPVLSRGDLLAGFCGVAHGQNGVTARAAAPRSSAEVASAQGLPARAARILLEA
jgi:hypothetical protein